MCRLKVIGVGQVRNQLVIVCTLKEIWEVNSNSLITVVCRQRMMQEVHLACRFTIGAGQSQWKQATLDVANSYVQVRGDASRPNLI